MLIKTSNDNEMQYNFFLKIIFGFDIDIPKRVTISDIKSDIFLSEYSD